MKKYNVILLLLDGVRADCIKKSSELEKISKQGLMFTEMISHAPYTLTSMASIFSGMYGGRSGVDAYSKMSNYKKNCKFLAEYLRDNGWHTVGDAMRMSLCPKSGFNELTSNDETKTDYIKAHKSIIDRVIASGQSPFFLYLHYPKIHAQIAKNVFAKYNDFNLEYFEKKEENLNNYVKYVKDAGLYAKEIFSKLESEDLMEDSIIIVMSDHGMGTGEKVGERAYGVFTYDYSIRTFSCFINQELFPPGKEIDEMVRTVDILPTILEILEIDIDKKALRMHGESLSNLFFPKVTKESLWSRLTKAETKRFSLSETGGLYGPWPSPDAPNVRCLRTKEWKLISNLTPSTWELYNLEKDPHELLNVYEENPQIASFLKNEMNKIISNY